MNFKQGNLSHKRVTGIKCCLVISVCSRVYMISEIRNMLSE